jgi:hypothetical protein
MELKNEQAQVEVPVFLSGIVSRPEGVDFCMDGATHRLQTILGAARLKPGNAEVHKFLDQVAGKKLRVAVAGYPVAGPECTYIRVYYAAPSHDALKLLGINESSFGEEGIGAEGIAKERPHKEVGNNCEWTAIHDFMPPGPARLSVKGKCTFPTPGFKVTLKRKEPQGINPSILILEKVVIAPTKRQPQHPFEVVVEYLEKTNTHYSSVQILPEGTEIPVKEVH